LTETNAELAVPVYFRQAQNNQTQKLGTNIIMLLDAPKNYVISFSSFSNIEEADDAFCKSALGLLDAEFCPLGGTLLEDDALRAFSLYIFRYRILHPILILYSIVHSNRLYKSAFLYLIHLYFIIIL
jgi:hypothetical protein